MGVTVSSLAGYDTLRRNMENVVRGGMVRELAGRVVGVVNKLVADGFRLSRDPYGQPWAPIKPRNRARDRAAHARRAAKGLSRKADKPLIDTGRMRSSVVVTANGENVRVAINTDYASYHQHGATIKPHTRSGRTIAIDDRGRFMSRKAARKLVKAGEPVRMRRTYDHSIARAYKIPRRQMLPEIDTGGLGPIWTPAINKEAVFLLRRSAGR